jgi:hypothetical protein
MIQVIQTEINGKHRFGLIRWDIIEGGLHMGDYLPVYFEIEKRHYDRIDKKISPENRGLTLRNIT